MNNNPVDQKGTKIRYYYYIIVEIIIIIITSEEPTIIYNKSNYRDCFQHDYIISLNRYFFLLLKN